jgi:hypothetical protein
VKGEALPSLIIISGGQSGVDRAALDVAIGLGVGYGGWCPRGGWAEDFPEPPGFLSLYPKLRETPSADPAERTERNVRDADATLILTDPRGIAASHGTILARALAETYGKPMLVADVEAPDATERVREWLAALLAAHRPATPFRLGIGGPRESEAPGIYRKARVLVAELLGATT